MFISDALAQTTDAAASQGSVTGMFIQLALIFLIFYLLLIRPQQKKIKQQEAMLAAIKKGDEVITNGGVYGKVVDAEPFDLTVEIAEGVKVKMVRSMVREVVTDAVKLPAAEKHSKGKVANSNKKSK